MGSPDTSATAEPGGAGRPEYDVDDFDTLTFARRYGPPGAAFTVYRSDFREPWGFDYDVTDLEDRPPELVWVESGMMTAHSGRRRWTLAPANAIWIPRQVGSEVIPNLPSRAFCVQFDTPHPALDPAEPTLLHVSPLARELLLRLGGADLAESAASLARDLLMSELVPADTGRLELALPADRRIRGIAAALLADPADPRGIGEFAAAAFCSTKTVQRAFRADTGLSFAAWRRTARVLASLPLLEDGVPVRHVAPRVGFADVGAYIAAFRAHFGCTPGRYLTAA